MAEKAMPSNKMRHRAVEEDHPQMLQVAIDDIPEAFASLEVMLPDVTFFNPYFTICTALVVY